MLGRFYLFSVLWVWCLFCCCSLVLWENRFSFISILKDYYLSKFSIASWYSYSNLYLLLNFTIFPYVSFEDNKTIKRTLLFSADILDVNTSYGQSQATSVNITNQSWAEVCSSTLDFFLSLSRACYFLAVASKPALASPGNLLKIQTPRFQPRPESESAF